MHKLKEVLRLKYLNKLSNRQIETMTGVSRSSVSNYLKVRETLEMELAELLELSDAVLNDLFTKKTSSLLAKKDLSEIHPNWAEVRKELSKKGMTRQLLWEELKAKEPKLYGYSQFNRHYTAYLKKLNPSMRQVQEISSL